MKHLLIFLFLAPLTVFGQFSKGTVAIGGNMSYNSTRYDPDNSDMPASKFLTMNPSAEVFISPSFSIGVFAQISSSKIPTINVITNMFEEGKVVSNIFGISARKYFPLSDKFLISINGGVGAGSKITDGDSENKVDQFVAYLSPVFTFLPHPKWGFEANIGGLRYEKNSPGSYYGNSNNFRASLGGLGLGVSYYINRKAE